MAEEVAIRTLEREDLESVNILFRQVFEKERSLEHWRWKYFDNPHGDAIAMVGSVDDRIVGLYGLIPRKVWWFEQLRVAWQEVDLMVDPEHGRGGLFKRLGRAAYDIVQEQDHPFTFGFPNQTSLPLGRRILGWRAIAPIPLWTLLLKPAEALADKLPRLPGISFLVDKSFTAYHRFKLKDSTKGKVVSLDEVPADIDHLVSLRQADIEFVRDWEYLDWRYGRCPDCEYKMYGVHAENGCSALAFVGRGENDRANICDFIIDPTDLSSVDSMIHQIADDYRQQGCHSLRAWAIEGNAEAVFFADHGFFNRNALNFHVIRSFKSPEFNRRLWDPARWYVSAGDSDCV